MKNSLLLPFLLIFPLCFSSCGGSDSTAITYKAEITLGDSDTTLKFVKVSSATEDANLPLTEDANLPPLETLSLGYGSIKYLLSQGSVPDGASNVPNSCKNRSDLGIGSLAPCVIEPLLASLDPILVKYGTTKKDVSVVVSYSTDVAPAYTDTLIVSAGETLKQSIDAVGYDGSANLLGHYSSGYTHNDSTDLNDWIWMANLKDYRKLSEISIPGTHDSMSFHGGDIVQTQSLPLHVQLRTGVRALDIRCRHIGDRFAIHHGKVYQDANFDYVLTVVKQFLVARPSETVIMRVGSEYDPTGNTRSFADTFDYYMQSYPGLFWEYKGSNNPTLAEMRGKIVILQDFPSLTKSFGIPWRHSAMYIQDEYYMETNWALYNKWELVKRTLNLAQDDYYGSNQLTFVNFLSGSHRSFPYFVASGKSSPGTNAPLLIPLRFQDGTNPRPVGQLPGR